MSRFKDCITPQGFAALQAEISQLWEIERPQVVQTVQWAAGNGDRSENGDYIYGKKRLRQIDSRVRYLRKRLENLTVVDPARQANRDQVFFGATVRYQRENGREQTVTIVGKDETEAGLGRISLDSPIGRALMNKAAGDLVGVQTPGGEEELEVMGISYPDHSG
ncbi:MAG: transcription elongation factor GreB [Rhodospirillaceae bacterium]|nr:transcription elongation factor GreB [Rhodospirillaceae bacterium]